VVVAAAAARAQQLTQPITETSTTTRATMRECPPGSELQDDGTCDCLFPCPFSSECVEYGTDVGQRACLCTSGGGVGANTRADCDEVNRRNVLIMALLIATMAAAGCLGAIILFITMRRASDDSILSGLSHNEKMAKARASPKPLYDERAATDLVSMRR